MSKYNFLYKLLVFCAVFFIIIIGNVSAEEETTSKCLICSGDPEIYEMEQQFAQRVKIFKSVLGNSVDEIALAATVLHKENEVEAVESRYDDNFKKSEYKSSIKALYGTSSLGDSGSSNKTLGTNAGVSAGQVDLLNAAAIIMATSSGWGGSYNEDKYKEALAGDSLIPNNDVANFIFCEAGKVADGVFTAGNIVYHFASGKDVEAEIKRSQSRWHNMEKICDYGYIGGIYDITPETEPDDELRQAKKEAIAQEIIDLIHYYYDLVGKKNDSCVAGTSGNFSSWKQCDPSWTNVPVGNGGSMCSIGCAVTSLAIQIARSGTQITNLPSGSSFNPGVFAEVLNSKGGFISGGAIIWDKASLVAPNFHYVGEYAIGSSNTSTIASALSKELSSGYNGKQKFLLLHVPGHYVALDSVSGNDIKIFDPGADDDLNGRTVISYLVYYADDVEQGNIGTSTASGDACGDLMQQFIEFLTHLEGDETCNYRGQGDGTGYSVAVLNDGAGPTTALGITHFDDGVAAEIGYTDFLTDLYSGCTNKEMIDKLAPAVIEHIASTYTDKQAEAEGVTLTEVERLALTSVNYGGVVLAKPIIAAIAQYGKDSDEVYRAFQNSFTNMNYADGLMRRRMSEYELFMTGNFKAESTQYLGWSNIYGNAISMSKSEAMSHWPTSRD